MDDQKLSLQVTTWNILNPQFENPNYYTSPIHKHLYWKDNRKALAMNYITHLDSDIFALQETTQEICDMFLQALNKAKPNASYKGTWQKRNKSQNDGCATLYNSKKLELKERIVYQFPNNTHISLATKFLVLETKFSFWILNAHVNWSSRIEDLITLTEELKKYEGPKFLMGDFNAEEKEEWYPKIIESGAIDTYKQTNNGTLPTFSYHSGKANKFLDFFFSWNFPKDNVKKSFLGNEISVNLDLSKINGIPNSKIPSDHIPVSVVFSLDGLL